MGRAQNEHARGYALDYLRATLLFYAPMAAAIVYAQAMNGRGDYRRPFLIDLAIYGVVTTLGAALVLAGNPDPGECGGFWAPRIFWRRRLITRFTRGPA